LNKEKQPAAKIMELRMKISERLKTPKDEKGGSLLTLLGISSIVIITSLSVAGAATFGTILTHENLANKQALDSADSGISEALFKLSNGSCVDTGSDTTLNYSYKIYHSDQSTAPTTVDAPGLVAGCPVDLDKWVLVQSEGTGKNDTKKSSIATFKWADASARVIPQMITGKQINLTDTEVLGSASGLKLRPTIYSKDGGVSCVDSLGKLNKNVNIAADQSTDLVDCAINGDIRSTADVDLNSAEIMGDVCTTGAIFNASKVAGDRLEHASTCGRLGSMYGYKPNYASNTVDVTAAACSDFARFTEIVESNYSAPTILNASSCGTEFTDMLSTTDNKTLNIGSNDLTVVIDEDTNIRNLTVETSKGPSSLNFVVPSDDSNSTQSSCATSASLNLEKVNYKDGANGIFYSPCSTTLKDSDISGQVYGGNSVTLEKTRINYYPIGLINTDTAVDDGHFAKHLVRVF
jgi:hypothetical protein